MIRRIAEQIKEGTKFFKDHGADNSHEGRETIGEAVVTRLKDIGGKMSAVVVGHFPDQSKTKDMDICSMETNVSIDPMDHSLVSDVDEISAVALGSSSENSPAFPGAQRLAAVQCFDKDEAGNAKEKTVTFEEVRAEVRKLNIFPSQLYSEEEVRGDRKFAPMFEDVTKLKSTNESLQKKLEEEKAKHETAVKDSQKSTAKIRLKEMLPEGLTEKTSKFIVDNFDPEKIDNLEEAGLKSYIENSQKEFTRMAKLFNSKGDESNKGKEESNENENENENEKTLSDPVEAAMAEITS